MEVEEGDTIRFALLLNTTGQLNTLIQVPLTLVDGNKASKFRRDACVYDLGGDFSQHCMCSYVCDWVL